MRKTLIFILIGFSFSIVSIYGLENYTGYVEPFQNSSRIQTLQNLILNSSINSIGFNQSAFGGELIRENLTDGYIDCEEGLGCNVEPNTDGYFRWITDYQMRGFTVPLDKWGYVYKDYGVNYFENIYAQAQIKFNGYQSNGRYFPFGFGNETDDWDSLSDAIGVRMRHINTPNVYQISLLGREGGSTTVTDTYDQPILSNADYWLNLAKIGTEVYLEIYSDSDRSILVDNLTISLSNSDKYRYAYYGLTDDVDLSSRWLEGRCYNFSFRYSGITEGVFYSKDLLSGISNNARALLYESLIDSGNSITIEISEDNSTWIKRYEETLFNGSGAISLDNLEYSSLYVRCNFSRPTGIGYCDLLSLNPIWESDSGGGGPGTNWGIAIILLVLGFIVGLGILRKDKG